MSALLAFAGKYRMKIFNMGAAAAFAFVTSWLYGDIAGYLQANFPQWLGFALVSKTLVVYAALFFLLWQLRPSERTDSSPVIKGSPQQTNESSTPSRLEELAAKPKLTSRKEAILKK
jgi:hypothetical protein